MTTTPPQRLAGKFTANRDRSRDLSVVEPSLLKENPSHWLDHHAGKRYLGCRLDNFDCETYNTNYGETDESFKACSKDRAEEIAGKKAAVEACRRYVYDFPSHIREGRGLVLIGPKGTGKDHLLVATLRAIAKGYGEFSIKYRSGAEFFDEFTDTIGDTRSFKTVAGLLSLPKILAISDPLPPTGDLSEAKQDMLFRVLTARYKNKRPTSATINVETASELERRMGPQAADRLRGDAVIVKCNWPSYRSAAK